MLALEEYNEKYTNSSVQTLTYKKTCIYKVTS